MDWGGRLAVCPPAEESVPLQSMPLKCHGFGSGAADAAARRAIARFSYPEGADEPDGIKRPERDE
jgi:hypothetical protein